MPEFLEKMFENENFPIYLGIIIAILLVTFCIVFLLGKKDQKKFEATQKLKTIPKDDVNAFKEESVTNKVEVIPQNKENEINSTNEMVENIQPVSDADIENKVEVPPLVQNYFEQKNENFAINPLDEISDAYISKKEAVFNEEINDLKIDDINIAKVPDFAEISKSIEDELDNLENLQDFKAVDLPKNFDTPLEINTNVTENKPEKVVEFPKEEISFEEKMRQKMLALEDNQKEEQLDMIDSIPEEKSPVFIPSDTKFKKTEVFSSVYAPSKKATEIIEDENSQILELPKLKDEK